MKLIDKDALVAEIEKRLEFVEKRLKMNNSYTEEGNTAWKRDKALYDTYNFLLSFINNLEVKEMDLEKEIQRQYEVHKNPDNNIVKNCVVITKDGFEYFAKHFFELGLKAQKGEEV